MGAHCETYRQEIYLSILLTYIAPGSGASWSNRFDISPPEFRARIKRLLYNIGFGRAFDW